MNWLTAEDNRTIRVCAIAAVLASVPIIMLAREFDAETGFLGFLELGRRFEVRALPELRDSGPPVRSESGYDGQFYAQLALDPTLRRPELQRALDVPAYRSRRIGLPVLAHCLGLGRPAAVLQIYALLNFAFWAALLAAFQRRVGLERPRDLLLAAALLWNTGTLVSVHRALTDFPAMALGVMAVWQGLRRLSPAGLLGAACLVKETSVLQILAIGWPERADRGVWRLIGTWAVMLLPVTAWLLYVRWTLPGIGLPIAGNFVLPFTGMAMKLLAAANDSWEMARGGRFFFEQIFELLAPASLAAQAIYLVRVPRLRSRAWRLGIGFVPLMLVLGQANWVEQHAFCRSLLPLTAAFNLLVHRHEAGPAYARWFLAGNVGMVWMLLKVLDL
jgi:hypothetical protein